MITPEVWALALELYARGCTSTRQGALYMAQHEPEQADALLTPLRAGQEMGHQADRASRHEWGDADTGQP